MNIRKFTDSVYYVGVNDRVTSRFEGLWPLPYGVSYNSYVVKGAEKTALIDTVHVSTVNDYIENIREAIGDTRIDYLVVNHMEPDHSGSIPEMLALNPEMKIIGNKQTIGMIKGFYHIDDDSVYLEVKEGDTIDLGGKTLRFVITPMVHWPETMMTYLVEEKVLFSGDAFGTFGALNGAVVDTDMPTDIYIGEMYRYYSNIVGAYGKFVQKAISKLDGVALDYICSTHGPVWHDRISEVTAIVDRLSKYESEPGVTIIYGSMYGNTAEVAELIARELSIRGVRNIKIHNASFSEMSMMISDAFRYEAIIVGGPTYSMNLFPPIESFMKAMETRNVTNKVFGVFGSYTWSPVVNKKIKEYAERMNLEVAAELSMKQSSDASTMTAIAEMAEKIVNQLPSRRS